MNPLIEVKNLSKQFILNSRPFYALHQINLQIYPGETLGLLGESGCGKSTLGKSIVSLCKPTAGQILYKGEDLCRLSKHGLLQQRRDLQIIFQDPYSSLNPRMAVQDIVREGLDIHRLGNFAERQARVRALLELVGLAAAHLPKYPHEFSGGQRQRIAIARALAVNPAFLVCDEPLSALDVSIQAQIIALLKELQERLKLTYLFISHDLSAVEAMSHRVAVMHQGRIIEIGPAEQICYRPQHPYTQALLAAVPIADPIRERARASLQSNRPCKLLTPQSREGEQKMPI